MRKDPCGVLSEPAWGALAYPLILAVYSPFYNRRLRKYFVESLGRDVPIRVQVELTESGMSCQQRHLRADYEWASVDAIEETGDAIYFHTGDKSVMAVRKRGFKTDSELAQFLDLARQYRKAHGHVKSS